LQGSAVSSATLSTTGSDNYACFLLCGSVITSGQTFSTLAGGGTLTSNLLASPTASSAITTANSFTINETITMNSYGPQQYTGHRDPEALHLSSVRQTFGTIPEPPAIIVLLTAIGGIAFIRRRMHG
jgi:hypothetical protein